jgi:hypothetical protein
VIPLVLYSIFFVVVVAGSCRLRCHSMCHCYMYPLIFRFTSDFWAKDSTTTGISVANVNTSSCCYSTFMMGLPQKINIIRNRQFPRSFTLLVRHRSTSPLCFHPHCLNLLDEVLGGLAYIFDDFHLKRSISISFFPLRHTLSTSNPTTMPMYIPLSVDTDSSSVSMDSSSLDTVCTPQLVPPAYLY